MTSMPLRQLDRRSLVPQFANAQWPSRGKVCEVIGTIIEASMPSLRLGTLVDIILPHSSKKILAEVVGFREDRALLLPFSDITGIAPGSIINPRSIVDTIPAGEFLLGKVIDPFFNCLNDSSFLIPSHADQVNIDKLAPNPMERQRIESPLSLGIRAIDSALTFGDGQRLGIMAGSGVGKSVLLGMIAKNSDADINIIGLIGERGREVREFLERDLGEEGLARSVVVAVTSDHSPLLKVRAAKLIHALAEYFSAKEQRVLLMMDSLTRTAMAQREIGLATGEAPTTKGYTPSVFSLLPRLLERSGPQAKGKGSISALYTVLVDGDDFNDPIADAARSILDGQINLTRRLAAKGHFPAIDVSTSVSRVMLDIVSERHKKLALKLKNLLGTYEENFDLVQIGAYQSGSNPTLDEALRLMPAIEAFLRQDVKENMSMGATLSMLEKIIPPSVNPAPENYGLNKNEIG